MTEGNPDSAVHAAASRWARPASSSAHATRTRTTPPAPFNALRRAPRVTRRARSSILSHQSSTCARIDARRILGYGYTLPDGLEQVGGGHDGQAADMTRRRPVSNPLALAVLASLYEKPMHPYEMAATMRERGKEHSIKLNYGSLYTVVDNLAKYSLIEAIEARREGRRPERTVYRLTDTGRTELDDWMSELLAVPVKEYPQFEAALSLMPVIHPDQVHTLLRDRVTALQKGIAEVTRSRSSVSTWSGWMTGIRDSAASKCGYSFTGTASSSDIQSSSSVRPVSVSRYTVRSGRRPSRRASMASIRLYLARLSTTVYREP